MQKLLRDNGVSLSKRQIAMDQNGDLNLNLTPEASAQMWKAGLLNESQLGAIANGGRARFSFAHNDLLVSSSTGFSRSARSDTSTRFEAGKQAGPDTVEHFLGGGAEGHAMMSNWLRGGFEMDRKGNWRLKPQVADTLQRDVQAIMTQTGWTRSLSRSASHQVTNRTSVGATLGGSVTSNESGRGSNRHTRGSFSGQAGFETSDTGSGSTDAAANMDIVNFDVRTIISAAEHAASKSTDPTNDFTSELSRRLLGADGLRQRYLNQAAAGRGTWDLTAPLTSTEQSKILDSGRFSGDRQSGLDDGN